MLFRASITWPPLSSRSYLAVDGAGGAGAWAETATIASQQTSSGGQQRSRASHARRRPGTRRVAVNVAPRYSAMSSVPVS